MPASRQSPTPERELTPYDGEGMMHSVEDVAAPDVVSSPVSDNKPPLERKAETHKFKGFITLKMPKEQAILIANQIYTWPVPEQVTQRMIIWTASSVRKGTSGAVASVWLEVPKDNEKISTSTNEKSSTTTKTNAIQYPHKTKNPHTVALFSIAAALRCALTAIDTPSTNILHLFQPNDQLYAQIKFWQEQELTRSHTHRKTKELFVFTESRTSMISLLSAQDHRTQEMREQVEHIKALSEQIEQSGIHLEVHWCPSCCPSLHPEKKIANKIARKKANFEFKAPQPA